MTRKEAKQAGLSTYEGTLHQKCGTTFKYAEGHCVECKRRFDKTPARKLTKKTHRSSPKGKAVERTNYLKKAYGISEKDYQRMLMVQDGTCAICPVEPTSGNPLHVDHDHKSGKIRGLLCWSCNTAIGQLRDDPLTLRNAITYLETA